MRFLITKTAKEDLEKQASNYKIFGIIFLLFYFVYPSLLVKEKQFSTFKRITVAVRLNKKNQIKLCLR